jgi:hypothetical protein
MTDVPGNGGLPPIDKETELKWLKVFSYLIGTVAVVICVAAVIVAATAGQWTLALLFVGMTLFWSIPYGQKLFIKRLVPRAKVDSTGTTLRPDRSVDVLAVAMMLIGLVTGGAWAALGFLGEVTWPFGAHYGFGYVIFFGGFSAFCAWYLAMMIRNSGTAYVRLTPDGCVLVEGFVTGRASWAEVTAVTDDMPVYTTRRPGFKTKKGQPYAWCASSIMKTDGTMAAVPNGNLYASNGDALRELIRFYWQHPEYRQELTDDRALARLGTWEPTAQ